MRKYIKIIIFILLISALLIYTYCFEHEDNSGIIDSSKYTLQEKYDILQEDYNKLIEKYDSLESQYTNLEKNNEYNEELIKILQNQLLRHNIEPEEL